MRLRYRKYDSPVGELLILGSEIAILEIRFPKEQTNHIVDKEWLNVGKVVERCARQLEEYFSGERKEFDLSLSPEGTPFQQAVWKALQQIPFGKTKSYSQIAKTIEHPKAVRAVGAANGANPIPIVIPCHRVIGANGKLTGFGGGLHNKEILLELEGATNARLFPV